MKVALRRLKHTECAVKATRGCNSKHKQLRCNENVNENEDQQSETAINQAKPINLAVGILTNREAMINQQRSCD